MTVIISDAGVQFPDASVQPSALTTGTQTIAGAKTFSGNATFSGLSGHIKSGTAQATTSGTFIDFTGIPAGVKRVTLMFNGVSTNGTSPMLLQLGTSGGIETTGYVSASNYSTSVGPTTTSALTIVYGIAAIADTFYGSIILSNFGSNIWSMNGNLCDSAQRNSSSAGGKTLSGALDRLRLTTVNGTDLFDAGSVNILYEG